MLSVLLPKLPCSLRCHVLTKISPALLVRVPYGPVRGRLWREVDDAYLTELLARDTGDRDVRFTARQEQARRAAQARAAPAA